MKISQIINNIFRQDFKDNSVLGRTLYGVVIFIIGAYSILDAKIYASYAPSYIPFAEFFAILFGVIFVISGFFILADMHLKKATSALIGLLLLLVVGVNLPQGDISALLQSLGFIGAALLVRSISALDTGNEEESN